MVLLFESKQAALLISESPSGSFFPRSQPDSSIVLSHNIQEIQQPPFLLSCFLARLFNVVIFLLRSWLGPWLTTRQAPRQSLTWPYPSCSLQMHVLLSASVDRPRISQIVVFWLLFGLVCLHVVSLFSHFTLSSWEEPGHPLTVCLEISSASTQCQYLQVLPSTKHYNVTTVRANYLPL